MKHHTKNITRTDQVINKELKIGLKEGRHKA